MANTNQAATLTSENGEKVTSLPKDAANSTASQNGLASGYIIQKPVENLTYDDYSILQRELQRFQRQLTKWEASDLSPAGITWFRNNVIQLLGALQERLGR